MTQTEDLRLWNNKKISDADSVFFRSRDYLQAIHVNEAISLFLSHLFVLLFSMRNDAKSSRVSYVFKNKYDRRYLRKKFTYSECLQMGGCIVTVFFGVSFAFQAIEAHHVMTVTTDVAWGDEIILPLKPAMMIGWGSINQ